MSESNIPSETENVEKRGRGRPKGSTNKGPSFKHYTPKRWHPWMDSLVLAKIAGATNEELAEKYEISIVHVSNILSTTQAQELIDKVRSELIAQSSTVSDRLSKIRELSLKRIEEVLANDSLATNSPLSFVDRALRFFEMASENVKDKPAAGNTIINGNVLVANSDYVERIGKGLELSNQIAERKVQALKEQNEALQIAVVEKPQLRVVNE